MADTSWTRSAGSINGVILDMCGVLYDSGEDGGTAIPGSVEAVNRLKASDLKLRFCTNETQASRETFVAKLRRMGFDVSVCDVFSPAPAAAAVLTERGLRPHLLVYDGLLPEFDSVDKTDPNCVVIGDAAGKVHIPEPEQRVQGSDRPGEPILFSLGKGRYYKETDGLKLDVGPFMKALEYACDVEAEVIGKPSAGFFHSVLRDMGLQPHQVLMIGDDLVNDLYATYVLLKRYYKETDGLKLDVGPFMKALEYACDVEAEVIGKPSAGFFHSVLRDMGLQPHQVPGHDARRYHWQLQW
ncbi:hypothetical protein CRUP_025569 [Coryphaenoides rupestris]|nr:hypothetical protein CRUP_025569 [Coryphaenoides rupestris]